ncbi:hypothetical protein [Cystobacter fuscus]|uniref:hypothetical protein n=1 Tax=Cystobacter fuscus TaxID=43 RepID=UPI002B301919|nr:hypothetical protein F0U63_07500 [Cystobacter fuscus]
MRRRLGRRGSVLLLVVVLLAVLSLLAAAALSFSRSELGAVKNERSGDELLSCADAGRQYVLSKFSNASSPERVEVNVNLNADLSNELLSKCPEDKSVPADARCMRTGHLGTSVVTGVKAVKASAGGNRRALRDSANLIGDPTLGDGVPYKITVHCLDENGRGTEVEFVVRFGL